MAQFKKFSIIWTIEKTIFQGQKVKNDSSPSSPKASSEQSRNNYGSNADRQSLLEKAASGSNIQGFNVEDAMQAMSNLLGNFGMGLLGGGAGQTASDSKPQGGGNAAGTEQSVSSESDAKSVSTPTPNQEAISSAIPSVSTPTPNHSNFFKKTIFR